jgi:ferric-dicitrate binding protein FerR (iron transport regulator)
VNASVKSAPGERSAFTVKGPASTAAVRGTEFDFDGYTLTVTEGTVQFSNLLGQETPVGAGDGGSTDGYAPPETGEQHSLRLNEVPAADAGGLLPGGNAGGTAFTPTAPTGTISITVQ